MSLKAWIQRLQWPLFLLAGSLVLLFVAMDQRLVASQRMERLAAEIEQLRHEVLEKTESLQLAERVREPFSRLVKSGVLETADGQGVWIQQLSDAVQAAGIDSASFRMWPPTEVRLEDENLSGIRIHRHALNVDMLLFHEGDLIAFLRHLLQRPVGLVQNRRCMLSETMQDDRISLTVPNLRAMCRFEWFTFSPDTATESDEEMEAMEPEGEV